jgi:hypothetical protein
MMHIDQVQIVLELDPTDYLCKHNWWLQFSKEEYLPYQQIKVLLIIGETQTNGTTSLSINLLLVFL